MLFIILYTTSAISDNYRMMFCIPIVVTFVVFLSLEDGMTHGYMAFFLQYAASNCTYSIYGYVLLHQCTMFKNVRH